MRLVNSHPHQVLGHKQVAVQHTIDKQAAVLLMCAYMFQFSIFTDHLPDQVDVAHLRCCYHILKRLFVHCQVLC